VRTLKLPLFLCISLLITLAACGGGGNSGKNISVSLSGASATILPNGTFNLTASVSGDSSNAGVTWSSSGAGGVLSNLTTTSATYTAPNFPPDPASVTITATSIANTTKSASVTFTIVAPTNPNSFNCQPHPAARGNESALASPFAFQLAGPDSFEAPIVYAGSFTADGSGAITAAALDLAGFDFEATQVNVDAGSSSYSYGTDGRGCLYLALNATDNKKISTKARHARANAHTSSANDSDNLPTSLTLSFVLSSPTGPGRVIAFDSGSVSGSITAGQLHAQSPSDFSVAKLSAHFAFGAAGWTTTDSNSTRVALAGSFANAAGSLSNGVADENVENISGTSSGRITGGEGSIDATIDPTTGRGTGHYETGDSNEGDVGEIHFTFYVVNGGDFYFISNDDDASEPLLAGRALASSATSSALGGYYITASSGVDLCESCNSLFGNASAISTMHVNGGGEVSGHIRLDNDLGTSLNGPYAWTSSLDAPSGRVAFTGTSAPVAYLTSGTSDDGVVAFTVGTDGAASTGVIFSAGAATPDYSAASISGTWAFGSTEDVSNSVGASAGIVTFDGTSGYTGTLDLVTFSSQGLSVYSPGSSSSGTYLVNADGTGSLNGTTDFVTNGSVVAAIASQAHTGQLDLYFKQSTEGAAAKSPRR
jgi:hypothetical protein